MSMSGEKAACNSVSINARITRKSPENFFFRGLPVSMAYAFIFFLNGILELPESTALA